MAFVGYVARDPCEVEVKVVAVDVHRAVCNVDVAGDVPLLGSIVVACPVAGCEQGKEVYDACIACVDGECQEVLGHGVVGYVAVGQA